MPNTFRMQEFVRMALDGYLEDQEGGIPLSEPIIYYMKKGRPSLAQRCARSLIAPRYSHPQRSHATQGGYITVFSPSLKPCDSERYERKDKCERNWLTEFLSSANGLLDDFYSSHAEVHSFGRWLEAHPFEEALLDDAKAKWMEV